MNLPFSEELDNWEQETNTNLSTVTLRGLERVQGLIQSRIRREISPE